MCLTLQSPIDAYYNIVCYTFKIKKILSYELPFNYVEALNSAF